MVVLCGKACSKIFSCPLESCCCISNVSLHNTALLCGNTLFPLYKPRDAFYCIFRGKRHNRRQNWCIILCSSLGKSAFFSFCSDYTQILGIYFNFKSDVWHLVTHLLLMKFSQEAAVTSISAYFSVGKVLFTFYGPSIRASYHRLFN